MKPAARRMENLSAHFFATLGAKIEALSRSGADVIRLDEGSPDLPPIAPIIDALSRTAALPDAHSYQTHRGPLSLREAWAGMYKRRHAVDLDPAGEIIPLLGSKEGVFHLPFAFVDPGDVVLIPDPGYVTYTRGALMAGGVPYYLPLLPQNAYLPDLDSIPADVVRRAKLLWLNYPNNPTTAVATLDFFSKAVDFARRNDILLCHDAAYVQVTFDGFRAPSILEVPGAKEVAVEFNSLSKSHNMAGWRVGALVGNPQALRTFYTLKTNTDSGHFLPVLAAVTEALTGDQSWLEDRNLEYRQRRDVLIGGLNAIGLHAAVPQASIYVWSPVPAGYSSEHFAGEVLEKAHVSLTPGTVFGQRGEGYVRISLTSPLDRLKQAVQRIANVQFESRGEPYAATISDRR